MQKKIKIFYVHWAEYDGYFYKYFIMQRCDNCEYISSHEHVKNCTHTYTCQPL